MATGLANVIVMDNGTEVSSGILQVQAIAPGIFTANRTGRALLRRMSSEYCRDGSLPPSSRSSHTTQEQASTTPCRSGSTAIG